MMTHPPKASPDLIVILRPDFHFQWFNEAYAREIEQNFGVAPKMFGSLEALLRPFAGIYEKTMAYWERAFAGETFTVTRRAELPSGDVVFFEITYHPIFDEQGGVTSVMQVSRNVTHWHRASPVYNTTRKNSLLDALPIQVFSQDRELRYTWGYVPSLPLGAEDIIGKTDADVLEREEDVRRMTALKLHVMQTREPAYERVSIYTRGMTREFEVFLDPLYDEDDEVAGIMVAGVDVTDQVKVEEQLQTVTQLHAQVQKEREVLAVREQFFRMVSHDFRTPLTVIATSQQILEGYYQTLPQAKAIRHLQKIGHQVEYMTQMLDEIVLFDRLRKGELAREARPMDLCAFCRDLLEDIEETHSGQHTFFFHAQQGKWIVHQYDNLLYRALVNLLTNAVKYSPDGGNISLRLKQNNGMAEIAVSDEGIGIPEEDLPHIFDTFYRAGNVPDREIEGSGLGLAITKLSVEECGGTIYVNSLEGEGTTFTVRFPLPTREGEAKGRVSG